ncbi:MAG: ATP-dependent zinc metalloprotease FtsH [Defluviitaleaceae bacterium]|nr:ATP-dependent zinc metalloprotease FtsH [Defluviitaleaceae bacterium]MCL2275546.1 ATP-dependent zinc metalloprotease FtsH [Defluviitaleaceae bacterium]
MNDTPPKKDPKGPPPVPPKMPGGIVITMLTIAAIVIILQLIFSVLTGDRTERIHYNDFLAKLEAGEVAHVEVQPDRLIVTLADPSEEGAYGYSGEVVEPTPAATPARNFVDRAMGNMVTRQAEQAAAAPTIVYTGRMPDPELLHRLRVNGVEFNSSITNVNYFLVILQFLLPFLLIFGFFILIRRTMSGMMGGRGGIMGIGQSNAKVYMEKKTGVTFNDVAGQEEAKESLTEIVDFLHNPDKYAAIGALQPKGALLVGPPGTGKTLMAKAVAGEASVVFFSLSGSDFVEMFVGVGASRVRDLFKQASQQAPCIIFIDEIDAIGKSRDNQMNSNDEREQTLNQLLAEMDGFDSSKGVVILGATNRPEILDKALLRPGRFDRRINVELPDLKGRLDILNVHAKKVKMGTEIDLNQIAKITPGAAGADLANMVNEAALHAVRMGRGEVHQEDLMEAVEVVIAGKEKKDRIMGEKEKRIVAFHEVGHALIRALTKESKPVEKITIIPRTKGSLGYVLSAPEEEKFITTRDEMISEIIAALGGRAAEEVKFNVQTTGAANDIEKATRMARSMVSMYGMSDKFGMMSLESAGNRYLDGRAVLNVSDRTGAELDTEVGKILHDCYQRAIIMLKENSEKMDNIAEHLFAKETMTGDEFMKLFKGDEGEGVNEEATTIG